MNERELMLRRLSAAQFALWETHIFLDTHPNDAAALSAKKKYLKKYETVLAEYKEKYGPLVYTDVFGTETHDWIKDPWPWEREGN